MKVVVMHGSPKMDKGNTYSILSPFIDGMKNAGADVELIFTNQLSIEPCRGELHCMLKSPGNCIIKDDMQLIYSKLKSANMWVFSSPVYFGGFASSIRIILERLCPLIQPSFETYESVIGHPWRETVIVDKIALVASCGSLELFNFDALIAELKCICRKCGKYGVLTTKFAGALLFQDARDLTVNADINDFHHRLRFAAMEAGKNLIKEGSITSDFQNINNGNITKLSAEMIVQKKNTFLKQII